MKLLISLCARGGSKGIPGKNVKKLGGRPLIDYSISVAKAFSQLYECKIGLSTDSDEIRDVARKCGVFTTYNRPMHLSGDQAGKVETITDLLIYEEELEGCKFDYVLDLDLTSPLRTLSDLQKAFEVFHEDENSLTLFSVNAAARNPYFNMVEQKENGYFHLVKSKESLSLTRQSAPLVYDLNASFYLYRRSFFDQNLKGVITERSLIFPMPHICFDLDHTIDFEFMEFLIVNDKLDFELL